MTGWDERWADELAEHCTDCGAPPGTVCTYLPVTGVDPAFVHYRSPKVQARMALIGQPTKRPHNARFNTTARRRSSRRLKELRDAWKKSLPMPVTRDTMAAARALNEFAQRETVQLRAWLAQYANVLTTVTKRTICWPDPDRWCLRGTCACAYNPQMPDTQQIAFAELSRYAQYRGWAADLVMTPEHPPTSIRKDTP